MLVLAAHSYSLSRAELSHLLCSVHRRRWHQRRVREREIEYVLAHHDHIFRRGLLPSSHQPGERKKKGDKRVNCVSDCPVTVSVRLKALVWLVVVVPVVVVTVTGQTTPNPVQEKEGRKKGKKRD